MAGGGRRTRGLSRDDVEEWHRYTRHVTSAPGRPAPAAPKPAPRPSRPAPPAAARAGTAIPTDFGIGVRAGAPVTQFTAPSADAGQPRPGSKKPPRLGRGKHRIEARLDLHGYTLAEARPELTSFVLGSQQRGLTRILVITGKGRSGPPRGEGPAGILRRFTPVWLAQPPLAQAVRDWHIAPANLGGDGALVLRLGRPR
ncbi:DNA mismatch repair protein MutS [Palleronia sediminis]|uniref:DNA mismatch repair protein MutS n=1 Tax=Palleronia sediminis TaxID=2547833 RepID=A0A4R6A6E8_9RHOB|nr:Smr/MutS family protein [Palleronia sediminis]TDL78332.1 DNA mismatch repair protein MutS [Palleronia sediminis]